MALLTIFSFSFFLDLSKVGSDCPVSRYHDCHLFGNYVVFDIIVSFILFFIFGHFWRQSYKNKKMLRNLCLRFSRQHGQDGKKTGKKIT